MAKNNFKCWKKAEGFMQTKWSRSYSYKGEVNRLLFVDYVNKGERPRFKEVKGGSKAPKSELSWVMWDTGRTTKPKNYKDRYFASREKALKQAHEYMKKNDDC